MRYLELTDFQLNPRDRLQKMAVFKQLASGSTKGFEILYKGKAMIGD